MCLNKIAYLQGSNIILSDIDMVRNLYLIGPGS